MYCKSYISENTLLLMKLNKSKFDTSEEANPIPFDKILIKISKIIHKTMLQCKILKSLSFTFQQATTKKDCIVSKGPDLHAK